MSKIQDLVLTVITHAASYNSRPCLRHIYVRLTSSTGTFDLGEKIWHERPSRDGEFHFYPGGVRNLSRKCLTTWLDEIRYQIMRSIQRKGHRVCVWMAKVKKGYKSSEIFLRERMKMRGYVQHYVARFSSFFGGCYTRLREYRRYNLYLKMVTPITMREFFLVAV